MIHKKQVDNQTEPIASPNEVIIPDENVVAVVAKLSINMLGDLLIGNAAHAQIVMHDVDESMADLFPDMPRDEAAAWVLTHIMQCTPLDEVLP